MKDFDAADHELSLNIRWTYKLRERPTTWLIEEQTRLEAEVCSPSTTFQKRTTAALALAEILKERERRLPIENEANVLALEALLQRPNLDPELRAWVRRELGYDP